MSALLLMFAFLTQPDPASAAAATPPEQEVEVVVPTPDRQVTCRPVRESQSRIARRRVCQTQAEREAGRDAEQSAAERALAPSNRMTGQTLNTSSYGNYARDRWTRPIDGPR